MGEDHEVSLHVVERVSQLSEVSCSVLDFFCEPLVPHDFSGERDIVLLLQGPEDGQPVNLTVRKEPSLSPIIHGVGFFFRSGVQRG